MLEVKTHPICVTRKQDFFYNEHTRVIIRPFLPGDSERLKSIVDRIIALPESDAQAILNGVEDGFAERHRAFRSKLLENYYRVEHLIDDPDSLDPERKILIGSYFTMEYSVESAALFNPSIVVHPDQRHVPEGETRFIMSFRATGEGHVSSLEFRSGILDVDSNMRFDPVSRFIETPIISENPSYDNRLFELKLHEMGVGNEISGQVLYELPGNFTHKELEAKVEEIRWRDGFTDGPQEETFETMQWLARSNYEISFRPDRRISERVLFPVSENESRGIEDARFVSFWEDDGSVTYYATYTAYNGFRILPQLLETKDFVSYEVITLNGEAVQNKGMALFPRRINGKYVMLSRQDGENLHLMYSNHLHFWQRSQIIQRPEMPWEFIQIGNCGSPLETHEGWLVLTHGVGPMREYCIGVILLDLDDPSKVIGHLNEPLIEPNLKEREGYVPNVVYTCGAMIHQNTLILPYAMSDAVTGFATVPVSELLTRLLNR
ncbi:glycoside hydrolase family 130 protein [Candidatus Hydrogenedentota bacterium]